MRHCGLSYVILNKLEYMNHQLRVSFTSSVSVAFARNMLLIPLVQRWFDDEKADQAKLPGEFEKTLNTFDRLILLRAMRPDRVSTSLAKWIGEVEYSNESSITLIKENIHLR